MLLARRTDDREIQLKKQNKIFFQGSGAGHEAVQVAIAEHLRPGSDWFYLYYRDRGLSLALGMTPYQHFLQGVAAESDPASGGRQMPMHFGHRALRIVAGSSPTGTQFLQAVGCAEAGWRAARLAPMRDAIESFEDDEVVLCCSGEGQLAEGEFWEALSTACNLKLPVIFLIEDNGYAISVPVEVNIPGGSISRILNGFPDLYVEEVDGCDVVASHAATGRAVRYCRDRKGPALVHAHVVRLYSHSASDDDTQYRPTLELERDALRDPIPRLRQLLLEEELATVEQLDTLEEVVVREVQDAANRALPEPQPAPASALRYLFSPDSDPTSSRFDTEREPRYAGEEGTMADLLNACLRDEMARDPGIVVFGQDVADCSREEFLEEVKGKGGVFKVTHGLQGRYGGLRVFNSPLAEANIVGRAIGMATRGLKPVVEIQFFDFIWSAMMQIRNELATLRYRSANAWKCPLVIRVAYGGYLRGGAIYHSQTGETLFAHTPGLRVVLPSTAVDAVGLLRTAIRCDDPVLFLEHKHLYRQVYNKGRYPGPDYMIPLGKAKVVHGGTDVTVLACGALVKRSLDAAEVAAERGISTEVIDLRSLNPLDVDAIAASVKKTNKVVIAHEDSLSWGVGAEIAARIAGDLFEWLDAPIYRVASMDTWVAYSPQLEDAILPDADDVTAAIQEVYRY
ncbi:MAG: dehydrogenase E1 component subunit alpha/beta [Gemmatimonadetes bacterium]|nr:dehydrogenase E1 component subunit alpha/beta [Gemmatimonadota bacterium]